MSDQRRNDSGPWGRDAEMDELLCEYVDGTMDPTVREVFEECLEKDPALAREVRKLRDTRSLLCRYGGELQAPGSVKRRLYHQLEGCLQEVAASEQGDTFRLKERSTLVGAVAAALVVGLCAGGLFFGGSAASDSVQRSASFETGTVSPDPTTLYAPSFWGPRQQAAPRQVGAPSRQAAPIDSATRQMDAQPHLIGQP